MYDRECISLREKEVEKSIKLCMRFMMVSCEVVEMKKSVEVGGLVGLAGAWRRLTGSEHKSQLTQAAQYKHCPHHSTLALRHIASGLTPANEICSQAKSPKPLPCQKRCAPTPPTSSQFGPLPRQILYLNFQFIAVISTFPLKRPEILPVAMADVDMPDAGPSVPAKSKGVIRSAKSAADTGTDGKKRFEVKKVIPPSGLNRGK